MGHNCTTVTAQKFLILDVAMSFLDCICFMSETKWMRSLSSENFCELSKAERGYCKTLRQGFHTSEQTSELL